jgi:polyhydroxyalkanoate synthesis repressor PhaR
MSSAKINPIVIKKYANRRLYNTDTSAYVTLDDLCQMIKKGEEVIVFDAKNGDDITRSVLTQIIVEQEGKEGQNLLPTAFLRQIISMYGNTMQQGIVPKYLEQAMQVFSKNQSQFQDYFRNAFGGIFPMGAFEELSKQNMAMVEQAMRMFAPQAQTAPSAKPQPQKAEAPAEEAAEEEPAPAPSHLRAVPDAEKQDEPEEIESTKEETPEEDAAEEDNSSIRDMQKRLTDLQKQIANMHKE